MNEQKPKPATLREHIAAKIAMAESGSMSGSKPEQPPAPREGLSRFRVHVNMNIPLAAEVVLEASSVAEAAQVAEALAKQGPVLEHFHHLIEIQTVSVLVASKRYADIRFESLILHSPPDALAWDVVKLGSGQSRARQPAIVPDESSK